MTLFSFRSEGGKQQQQHKQKTNKKNCMPCFVLYWCGQCAFFHECMNMTTDWKRWEREREKEGWW